MTDLPAFITERLDEAEEAIKAIRRPYRLYIYDDGTITEPEKYEFPDDQDGEYKQWADGADYLRNRHQGYAVLYDPDQALREVAAKRRVLDRHTPTKVATTVYCDGCPGDADGFPDVELNDCPELQDLAYIWNDHEDWNPRWCPHVEGRHEAAVPELPPARGAYTNACNRCGTGDGWHYRKDRTA